MDTFLRKVHSLLDLREDTDYKGTDESIRLNVKFKSANAWTLVFAIFIASVGLNVNSPAVIIGAMLISPLMGPIVGAGYALGVNDFSLLKNSGKNLIYAVAISLLTSTIYFWITPFNEVQSELLARTSPNFYDVMIAIFGGAAGIVAISRTEKSNAIPGVAIATALMPPLCTAGFGIATLDWKFFVGALYLFVINSVFICLTTYLFVRYLRFEKVSYSNPLEQSRINRWIIGVSIAVVIPSFVTAWILLAQSSFRHKANQFVDKEFNFRGTFIIDKKFNFDFSNSTIELTLIGTKLKPSKISQLDSMKSNYGLEKAELNIKQVAIDEHVDARLNRLQKEELPIKQRVAELEMEIKNVQEAKAMASGLLVEIQTFLPNVFWLAMERDFAAAVWSKRPSNRDRKVLEEFIHTRLGGQSYRVQHSVKL